VKDPHDRIGLGVCGSKAPGRAKTSEIASDRADGIRARDALFVPCTLPAMAGHGEGLRVSYS